MNRIRTPEVLQSSGYCDILGSNIDVDSLTLQAFTLRDQGFADMVCIVDLRRNKKMWQSRTSARLTLQEMYGPDFPMSGLDAPAAAYRSDYDVAYYIVACWPPDGMQITPMGGSLENQR